MSIEHINISEVMRAPHLIKDSSTFFEVLTEMVRQKTNSLIVTDSEGKVVGEVSVLNLLKQIVPHYISDESEIMGHFVTEDVFREDIEKAKNAPVTNFMVENPPIITLKDTLVEATVLAMSSERSRVVVVDEAHKPIGVLTRTEIKQAIGKYFDIPGCFPNH